MNLNEVKKHVYFNLFLYVLIGLCFIISIIAILITPVSAKQVVADITSTIYPGYVDNYGCNSGTTSRYCAIQTNGSAYSRPFGTTYNGVLNTIEFEMNFTFRSDTQFTFDIYANSNDFRNNSDYVYCYSYGTYPSQAVSMNCSFRFISKTHVQVIYPYNTYSHHFIQIGGSPFTGESNYNLKSVYLTYDDGNPDNSGIIDNATQNTTDIINNNNENFSSLLSLDKLLNVDSINTQRAQLYSLCNNSINTPLARGKKYNVDGSTMVDDALSFYTPDYISITSSTRTIAIQNAGTTTTPGYYLFAYDTNKNLLDYWLVYGTRTMPSGTAYIKFSAPYPGILLTSNGTCQKPEDAINSYLQDDSNPTLNENGINDAMSSVEVTDPLNYLLTLPISLLQKLNTVLSANSCQRVSFGNLYEHELYLPCINFENILGSSIWGTIDLIVGVGLLAIILKRFYDSISNILTLGKEKEVRDKLDLPTPMQFMASILGGGRD